MKVALSLYVPSDGMDLDTWLDVHNELGAFFANQERVIVEAATSRVTFVVPKWLVAPEEEPAYTPASWQGPVVSPPAVMASGVYWATTETTANVETEDDLEAAYANGEPERPPEDTEIDPIDPPDFVARADAAFEKVKEAFRQPTFPCTECDRSFGSQGGLTTHRARMHSGKNWSTRPERNQPTPVEDDGPPIELVYVCTDCGAEFKRELVLRRHVWDDHSRELKQTETIARKAAPL